MDRGNDMSSVIREWDKMAWIFVVTAILGFLSGIMLGVIVVFVT